MKNIEKEKSTTHFKKYSFEYFMFSGVFFGSILNLLNVIPTSDQNNFWLFFIIDSVIIVGLFILFWYIEDKRLKIKKNSLLNNFIEEGYIVHLMLANMMFVTSLLGIWGLLTAICTMTVFGLIAIHNSIIQKRNNKKVTNIEMSRKIKARTPLRHQKIINGRNAVEAPRRVGVTTPMRGFDRREKFDAVYKNKIVKR